MGQVMRGRGRKKEEETGQVGRSYSNSGRINITASDRRLPHSGNDGGWSPATRDGFRDTKLFKREDVTIKKGSFHVREMVDATIADRDEVMKLDDMGRCGN